MFIVPNTAGPGAYLTLRVLSPAFVGLDLTQVSALSTDVLRQDESTDSWAWTIIGSNAGELVAQYAFLGTEFTGTGLYRLAPKLTIPGGVISAFSVGLFVSNPFKMPRPQGEEITWIATSTKLQTGSSAVSWKWNLFDAANGGSQNLSPLMPKVKTKTATGPLDLTLWTPNDGDSFEAFDYLDGAAAHNVTFTPNATPAGTQIRQPGGGYGASATWNTNGFVARYSYDKDSNLWLLW